MIPVYLLNLVLAAALGGLLGGTLGLGVGLGVAVLAGITLHFAPGIMKKAQTKVSGFKLDLPPLPVQPEKPNLQLPALPKIAVPPAIGAFVAGIGPFFAGFISERALPFTIGNAVLALLAAGLVLGVQVALYTALIAVPVVLVALMLLAVYSGPSQD